ncbi:MAG: DNA topoisomerase IB [Acidobacteriota bacterium]
MTLLEKLTVTGLRRLGTPRRGFRYVRADGRPGSASDVERIRNLRIPPAWKDVLANPSPQGAVQAMGKDGAGRWQYLYHERRTARREREKFDRLVHFADALPKMRRAVTRDLALKGIPREKVLACVLRILSTCFLRPGSQVYAEENGSYGIATLRAKHVRVRGDLVTFDFPGKWGKKQHRELRDRRVARIVRELARVPGEVFKYRDDEGKWVDIRRRHINEYIKELMGDRFSAKDFRTWAGTLICACALARAGTETPETKTARKRKVVAAVKETAEMLGNTPAICRSSYIYPAVISSFDRGRVLDRYFDNVEELVERRAPGLHGSEKALLKLLKNKAS